MPIIVLEGPDEAGKTTLAGELRALFPQAIYLKSPAGNPAEEWDSRWLSIVKDGAQRSLLTIMDRCPQISEPIYSWVTSRPNRIWRTLHHWDRMSEDTGLCLVLCQSNPDKRPKTGDHIDGRGIEIRDWDKLIDLYDFVGSLFVAQSLTRTDREGAQVVVYRYWDNEIHDFAIQQIVRWEREREIRNG